MARKWWTLIAVSVATFMLLLDVTVVNVALPEIQRDLGAGFTELQWVIDAYALTLAATLLIFGSLADRLGRRRVFAGGLAAFSLASLGCGLAWDPLSLDLFRGLQGFGGAAMLATSLALIAAAYTGRDRSIALAVWGATTAGSVAVGPLVGGVLIEAISWESIFFVNIPIGLVTALLVARAVPESRDAAASGPPDYAGLATMAGSASLLVLALFRGNDEGWGSPLIVSMLAGSAALLATFVAIERRAGQPMLDLALFRKPSTWGASLAILFTAFSAFALLTFLVLYIQNGLGYDALETGVRLLPLTIAAFFAAAVAGRLGERVPPRFLIAFGLTLAGIGLLVNRQVEPGSDWTALLAGCVLIGIGIGAVNPSVAAAALGTVPVAKSGMASGLNGTFRVLGVAIGVPALGAIVESEVSASLGPAPDGVVDAVATGNMAAAAGAEQAFVAGLDAIFLVGAIVAFAGAALALALVRPADAVAHLAAEPVPA
jgi:EmrB/QacA subfamily drug resistance transporter